MAEAAAPVQSRTCRLADVEANCVAAPDLMPGVRDHSALWYNLRAVAALLDLRVEPPVAVAVHERADPLNASAFCDRAWTARRPSSGE